MMGRKKGKTKPQDTGGGPRRGKRRSIRYEAEEQYPEDRKPVRDDAPPSIHLRKLTVNEALDRLETQLRGYAGQGRREILVVHGKGQGSVGGISILGPEVRDWCDRNPALVSSWREAPPRWGGSGAIVVVLNP
jgi:DNA-nicking Smr family endonuclease